MWVIWQLWHWNPCHSGPLSVEQKNKPPEAYKYLDYVLYGPDRRSVTKRVKYSHPFSRLWMRQTSNQTIPCMPQLPIEALTKSHKSQKRLCRQSMSKLSLDKWTGRYQVETEVGEGISEQGNLVCTKLQSWPQGDYISQPPRRLSVAMWPNRQNEGGSYCCCSSGSSPGNVPHLLFHAFFPSCILIQRSSVALDAMCWWWQSSKVEIS